MDGYEASVDMAQEATKTEYAIALLGLAYIGAFTAAEQVAELGGYTYHQVRKVFGDAPGEDAHTARTRTRTTDPKLRA